MATCVACQAPAHTWRLTGGHYGERALFSVDCVSMQIQCAKKYGSGTASATTAYFQFLVEFNLAKTSKNVGTYPKWWEWWIWWHFFFLVTLTLIHYTLMSTVAHYTLKHITTPTLHSSLHWGTFTNTDWIYYGWQLQLGWQPHGSVWSPALTAPRNPEFDTNTVTYFEFYLT